MTISLSKEKKSCIKGLCLELLADDNPQIRKVARLLGKFTSSFPAVQYGPLHYRALERDKIASLRISKGSLDKKMTITFGGKQDIHWWMSNIDCSTNPIHKGTCKHVLKTDASSTGWGAVYNNLSTGGVFTSDETISHINVLELKAVLFGLQSLCKNLRNTHIKVLVDNTTAVHTINNMGSCKSTLM